METIQAAIEALKAGKTILYPTDTIWGIGCDATDEAACRRILEIKQRPEEKSFIVLVDSVQMLEKYVPEFPEVCYDLIDYADKPLTIIYPSAKGLAPSVLGKDGTVGIRVTKDPVCIKLIRALKKPIVSTSANKSGSPSPGCFAEIDEDIKSSVDEIVKERLEDKSNSPSQIIRIGIDSSVQIIRK